MVVMRLGVVVMKGVLAVVGASVVGGSVGSMVLDASSGYAATIGSLAR